MGDAPTRTKLRLSLIRPKRSLDDDGVTSEELDVLLAEAPETKDQSPKRRLRKNRNSDKK